MKTTRKFTLGLAILVLAAGLAGANDAQAQLKVRATLTAPGLHVRVGNVPRVRLGHLHGASCRCDMVTITRRDRRIAQRIAVWTGVPARALLDHRRHGASWQEIARAYDVPRRVVRLATESREWQRPRRGQARREVCRVERPRARVHVKRTYDLR